jgi:tetratricopeptide (TPR) repeat protein
MPSFRLNNYVDTKISGLLVVRRQSNHYEDRALRKDTIFPLLARMSVTTPAAFERLCRKVDDILSQPRSELSWALKGYCAYLRENYAMAQECFLEAVIHDPLNVDNWMDLAFALRHSGEYQASEKILFHLKHGINVISRVPCSARKARILQGLGLRGAGGSAASIKKP